MPDDFGRPSPNIHNGMRTPRQHMRESRVKASFFAKARGIYDERKAREEKLNPQPENPYKVIFNSKYGAYRVQLTSPRVKEYMDGTKEVVKGLVAQFRKGVFRIGKEISCKKADDECKSELHPACDAWDLLTRLKRHKQFGIGKDFWLMTEAVDDGKVLKAAETMQYLTEDEDGKAMVLDMLAAHEFEAEALASSDRPARPIPGQKRSLRATATGYVPTAEMPEAPVELEASEEPEPDEPEEPLEDEPVEDKRKGKKKRPRRPGY